MEYDPKIPRWSTSDRNSFGYVTARDRWPVILTSAIDETHRHISSLSPSSPQFLSGKPIIASLARLKYEVQHDRPLSPLSSSAGLDIDSYNNELEALGTPSWFSCPSWLFAECYLYRRLAAIFAQAQEWKKYDVFARQKIDSYRSSRRAVLELAARYREMITRLKVQSRGDEQAEEKDKLLFREMSEVCLWGNATDLSLLTSLTYQDLQRVQGEEARRGAEKNVLVNDIDAAYEVLLQAKREGKKERKIDIVLDNAGFELFVDLVFAGFLLTSGLATNITLHPKSIPWFVSDALPTDFAALLNALANPGRFFGEPSDDEKKEGKNPDPVSQQGIDDLGFLFGELSGFHAEGQLVLRPNGVWTEAGSFWRLPALHPQLMSDFQESLLVVFKGDLNYRKLTGDAMWDPTTAFAKAIGPLGSGSGINLLSLRTCKSDVVVGLQSGRDEELKAMQDGGGDSGARKWAWSGKWAVISFSCGRRAPFFGAN